MATPERGVRFQGAVYRAHNPEWAWDPLSGEGAKRYGGRFNRKGVPALYTSLDVFVAVREASPLGTPFQPITLCEYRVDCEHVFDSTDAKARKREKVTLRGLESPRWNEQMLDGGVPTCQAIADRLIERGYAAMIVRSYAKGAGADDLNLVFWHWTKRRPHRVTVVDPNQRLPRDASSWRQ